MKLHQPKTLVGREFTDLTVIRRTAKRQGGHIIWECRCICGRHSLVRTTRL